MVHTFFIDLPGGRVHVRRFGRGSRLLIALHGFGDNGAVFSRLTAEREGQFTVYAPDLPFHGRTAWGRPSYGPADLVHLVDAILARERAASFSWLGFSFGGRLILATLDRFASRVEQIFLVAPDGPATRGMTLPRLVPGFLRRGWLWSLRRPVFWLRLGDGLYRMGFIGSYARRFLHFFLANPRRRDCLSHTWLSLTRFPVRRRRVRRFFREHRYPICVFLGRHDEVTPAPAMFRLFHGLPGVEAVVVDADHDSLLREDIISLVISGQGGELTS